MGYGEIMNKNFKINEKTCNIEINSDYDHIASELLMEIKNIEVIKLNKLYKKILIFINNNDDIAYAYFQILELIRIKLIVLETLSINRL
jgi:hypothetical protein